MSKRTKVRVVRVLPYAIQDDPLAAGILLGANGFYHEVWERDKGYCFTSIVEPMPELLDAIDFYVTCVDGIEEHHTEAGILLNHDTGVILTPDLEVQVVFTSDLSLPK